MHYLIKKKYIYKIKLCSLPQSQALLLLFPNVISTAVFSCVRATFFVVPEVINQYLTFRMDIILQNLKLMQNITLLAIVFSITILLGLIQWTLYQLFGSIVFQPLVSILGFYYFCHYICELITIPASNKLYRWRDLLDLNDEQVLKTLMCLSAIGNITLTNLNQTQQNRIRNAVNFLFTQHIILSKISSKNKLQQQYFNLLSNLCQLFKIQNLTIEQKKQIKEWSKEISKFLEKNQNVQDSLFHKINTQKLFASLEQRRLYILMNQNIERVQIFNDETGSNLDCLFIKTTENSNKAILFCNPNAAIYEHLYFHNDWFQFYHQIDFNVITWNYCGFGESTGKPSLQNFIKDGIFVAQYLKNRKQITILGAHGQSLGGMIASEVAKALQLSFLIADRSFSSLGQVASVRFQSSFLRLIYNLLCSWDHPNYLSFYYFNGPKLIIQNANDDIIPYASQLQTSMVRCYFSQKNKNTIADSFFNKESQSYLNYFYKTICRQQKVKQLCKQLNWIFSLEKVLNNEQQMIGKKYQSLTEENDVESFQQAIDDLKNIFQILNYNGNKFWDVMELNANEEKVALFFGSCFTYGIQRDINEFDESFNSFKVKEAEFLNQPREFKSYSQLKDIMSQISEQIKEIVEKFKQIHKKNDESLEMTGYTNELNSKKRFRLGELIVVKSAHNSNLTQEENMKVYQFISQQNFQ